MPAAANGAARRPQESQDESHNQYDDADRPEDRYRRDEADNEQDKTENDHCDLL